MTPLAIVSYDGTPGDRDALMLGRLLRDAGARLTLAYVRHAVERCPDTEQTAHRAAAELLARGARWLGTPDLERRVVFDASTGEGLARLARAEAADILVFGSDYRTGAGHLTIGRSAARLLEGGPAALALAPAGLAGGEPRVGRIGVLRGTADEAAIETAFSLAAGLEASVVDRDRAIDLLVVGSRPEARPGQVMITARAHHAIEQARCPVLVVAHGTPLSFTSLVPA